jgi:hypothetical protein
MQGKIEKVKQKIFREPLNLFFRKKCEFSANNFVSQFCEKFFSAILWFLDPKIIETFRVLAAGKKGCRKYLWHDNEKVNFWRFLSHF